MAGTAAFSIVANAMTVASGAEGAGAASRLGATIDRDLKTRDVQLAERVRALQLREQIVKATENRIKANMAPNPDPPETASAQQRGAASADQPNPFDTLARIYQAMKPNKASVVFEQLDMDVQVAVAKRMRERSTAMMLASMSPSGAARLSMALAGKRAVPPSTRQPTALVRPTAATPPAQRVPVPQSSAGTNGR
jgi:flagellar motility protein MotE (MotC chaperone)